MDGWNTTFLLGFGLFSGATLVSGRVPIYKLFKKGTTKKLFIHFYKNIETNYLRTSSFGGVQSIYNNFFRYVGSRDLLSSLISGPGRTPCKSPANNHHFTGFNGLISPIEGVGPLLVYWLFDIGIPKLECNDPYEIDSTVNPLQLKHA